MQRFQSNFFGNSSGGPVGNSSGGPVGNSPGGPVGNSPGGPVGNSSGGSVGNSPGGPSGNSSSSSRGSSIGNFSSRIIKVDPCRPEASAIQRAAEVVIGGGLLIFPTDTVYGLGCSAFHEPGLERIFSMKERPAGKPLPVLVSEPDQLANLDLICGPVSPLAQEIIREFWPGALTLIFPASDRIPNLVTAGTKTIGVRMPKCRLVLDLIAHTRLPLVATSVNISGMPVLQEMSHLIAEWVPKVDLILDGGAAQGGIASTVLDLTTHPPKLLREGAISAQRLQRYLKPNLKPSTGPNLKPGPGPDLEPGPGPDQKATE
jgi:L-threonylcarbamoyladenylate synthase